MHPGVVGWLEPSVVCLLLKDPHQSCVDAGFFFESSVCLLGVLLLNRSGQNTFHGGSLDMRGLVIALELFVQS